VGGTAVVRWAARAYVRAAMRTMLHHFVKFDIFRSRVTGMRPLTLWIAVACTQRAVVQVSTMAVEGEGEALNSRPGQAAIVERCGSGEVTFG
jgi:hypothetical protein